MKIRSSRTSLAATTLAALFLGACAGSVPERPAYDAPDRVGDVDPARLVGVWNVTPLNPYPEQPEQSTVIEYRSDGTVVGEIDPGDVDPTAALGGDLRFEMTGNWAVADGSVAHSDVKMEALSDNALARFVSGLINNARRDLGGSADIRELDDDRIVMLGDDGAAMRYDRVR